MSLFPTVRQGDWTQNKKNWQKAGSIVFGQRSEQIFANLTLTGLTASQLLQTDADKKLTSIALPLIVAKGGTGATTLTDHGILLGSGTGAITALGVAANGQLPIGSAGADPVLAGITGTSNQITVTNGAGSITLSAPQNIHTGASPTFVGLTLSGLTATRIPFAGTGGLISDDAGLVYASGTGTLSATILNATDENNILQIDGTTIFKTGLISENNLFVGYDVGKVGLGGASIRNVAIGSNSMTALTTGDSNVAIGVLALSAITEGLNNFALGKSALEKLTTGSQNVAIGVGAGSSIEGAASNMLIGTSAGGKLVSQSACVYIGTDAGKFGTAQENIAIGKSALQGVSGSTNGIGNVIIGHQAGLSLTTGGKNIIIGWKAGRNQTTNSNLLIIDNQDRGSAAAEITNCLIYGVFNATVASQSLRFNVGDLTLASATPYQTLVNDTHEDTDGGRESRINFKGEQSGGELTTLARIEAGHDGAVDDEKGHLDIFINDGDDGNSPTKIIKINSTGFAVNTEINGELGAYVENDSTGVAAFSTLSLASDDGRLYLHTMGSNYTTFPFLTNKAILTDSAANAGLAFIAMSNTGIITFSIGGMAAGDEVMRLNSTGLGIGDTAPGEKLDVNGNTNVTGVYKVDDVQVVSNQQAHIVDAPGDTAANNAVTINAILVALETHGLLAAA